MVSPAPPLSPPPQALLGSPSSLQHCSVALTLKCQPGCLRMSGSGVGTELLSTKATTHQNNKPQVMVNVQWKDLLYLTMAEVISPFKGQGATKHGDWAEHGARASGGHLKSQ